MKLALRMLLGMTLAATAGSTIRSQSPAPAGPDPNQIFRDFARLHAEVLAVAMREYGTEVAEEDLIYSSIQGLLQNLDPHTSFLTPKAYQHLKERQAETYFGIGCLVGKRNEQITVITPLVDTPASRAGLRTGDVITAIDGESTEGLSVSEAVDRIKGPKGSQVELTIARHQSSLSLKLRRAEIPQETVRYAYMLTPEVGYLSLVEFGQSTAREVEQALDSLRQGGMTKFILDLRNNVGGMLQPAVEVADHFVPEGAVIVDIRARVDQFKKTFRGSDRYPAWTTPLVVLVNAGTASAGEILSGAIQDNDLGLLVGTRTWGKGLVQTVYNLSYGAGIALTTARYHTPSGRQIQRDYSSYYDYYRHSSPDGADSLRRGEQGGGRPQQEFKTTRGRTVLGGGGVRPDVVVELEEPSPFTQSVYARNGFLNFATRSLQRSGFDPESLTDQQLLADFANWLSSQGDFSKTAVDRALSNAGNQGWALAQVRSDIALAQSGRVAAHRVLATQDAQIQRALELFDEAAGLLARRQK